MATERRDTRERILHLLKTGGPATAQALADRLGVTGTGARQHLKRLAEGGFVAHRDERSGVGRPARRWSLTALGDSRFQDGHADLAVSFLETARKAFGARGVDKLVDARTREQTALYRERLDGRKSITKRLEALAEQRTAEGYMAEWREDEDGTYLLVENHCPIRAAAQVCQGLCRSELDVFRNVLGEDATVERIDHRLAGARRCSYRVAPAASGPTVGSNGLSLSPAPPRSRPPRGRRP